MKSLGVTLERNDYKETTGLWKVVAYQIIDGEAANDGFSK